MADVVVVGAGHNGLVAATLLARAGLAVEMLERAEVVGGACRTEYPFGKAPGLAASTGAYLLGLMPPELLRLLGLDLPLVRRDPHYFLPTLDGRHLLLGADPAAARPAFAEFFTEQDARADADMSAELAALREDLAPAWLAEPLPLAQTADRYVRPALRETFVAMVRGSAIDYLSRFGFASETVVAMYAVTDGMPGLTGSPWSPGSGHNLLVDNMCRLPGAGGTWMVVRGGMGTVTGRLAELAVKAGAQIRLGTPVDRIEVSGGTATGVVTAAGEAVPARAVLVAADAFRLPGLLGRHAPAELVARIDGYAARSPGQTMKINLALAGLPRFAALPQLPGEPGYRGQHGSTVHLLPPPAADGSVLTALREAFADAAAGRLPDAPPLEWYLHSALDPSVRDDAGNHTSAVFVQGVPHQVAGSSWPAEKAAYVEHLLDLVDAYAPGTRDLVVDVHALTPPEIRDYFGISSANIHHVDNSVAFADRMPYRVGVAGVYAGAAGCHPAGSVIGCAGHNAAQRILGDLGMPAAR
jgi:phytoene dehydrogenase-like protein